MSLQINIMPKCIVARVSITECFRSLVVKVTCPSPVADAVFHLPVVHPKMHISAFFLVVFTTITIAQVDYCAGNKATIGYCETLSYTDYTFNATDPPSSSDCQDACRGVLTDAGDWGVDFKGTLLLS
jgi:hypothetical protein